jgi:hypothetical protein
MTHELGWIDVALAEVRGQDQHSPRPQNAANLAQDVADGRARHMLDRVEGNGGRAGPGPDRERVHVPAHNAKIRSAAHGDGDNPARQVHADDVKSTIREVFGDLGRPATEVENR